MSNRNQADLFAPEPIADLFGAETVPAYRPNPEKVRARLRRILSETRARSAPWEIGACIPVPNNFPAVDFLAAR